MLLSVGDGVTNDTLTLNDKINYIVQPGTITAPPPATGSNERTVTMPLAILGGTAATVDQLLANYRAIETKFEQARKGSGAWYVATPVTLGVQFGTGMVYFDVKDGSASPLDLRYWYSNYAAVTLTFTCYPFPRGSQLTATNLLLQSAAFDQSAWAKTQSSVTADATTAPNGATVADKLIGNTSVATHNIHQIPTTVGGTTYIFSVYVKSAGYTTCRIAMNNATDGTFVFADVNLATGAKTAGTGTFASSDAGNGWYRLSVTGTPTVSGTQVLIYPKDSTGTAQDGTSGIYLWGASLQQTATLGPYLETGASLTLVNGVSPSVYLYDVPGDVDALANVQLTDVSTSGLVISRVRMGRKSLPISAASGASLAAADFTPVLTPPVAIGSGATQTTDGSSILGGTFTRITAASTYAEVADFKPGASARFTTGLYDVYAKVRDASAASPVPVLKSISRLDAYAVQSNFAYSNVPITTLSVQVPQATVAGNTQILYVWHDASTVNTVPSGFTVTRQIVGVMHIYTNVNAASINAGLLTVTFNAATRAVIEFVEVANVIAAPLDTGTSQNTDSSSTLKSGATSTLAQNYEFLYAGIASSILNTGGSPSVNWNVSAFVDQTKLPAATQGVITGWGVSLTTAAQQFLYAQSNGAANEGVIEAFTATLTNAPTIPAGTYSICVCNGTGTYVSGPSNQLTVTVPNYAGLKLTFTTGSISNAYQIFFQSGSDPWKYITVASVTGIVSLTDLSNAVVGNPPLNVNQYGVWQAAIGLASGTSLEPLDGVRSQVANSTWHLLKLGSGISLPPAAALEGQAQTLPYIQIRAYHPTSTPTLDVDSVWLIPHDEPNIDSWFASNAGVMGAPAAQKVWQFNSRRDARSSALLLTTGTLVESGQASYTGFLTIGRGANQLVWEADTGSGVCEVTNTKVQVALTITPRYRLLAGVL